MSRSDVDSPRRIACALLVVAVVGGCRKQPSVPQAQPEPAPNAITLPDGPPVRVLFLGNSLTAGNDLPGMVQAMAAAGGVRVEYRAFTPGGVNLEDHWNQGAAKAALHEEKWDFLVLQQGPSTRPESQTDLREWAKRWADAARGRGAKPALYMVWPYRTQADGFALVSKSYRGGAEAAGARVFAAGEAWAEALVIDPAVALYVPDDLHPTEAGTYLAALVVCHGLTGVRPSAVPNELTLMSGQRVSVPAELAAKLRRAADAVIDPVAPAGKSP